MIICAVPCPQLMNTWELSIMILADSRLKRLSCFNKHEHIAKFVLFVSEPLIYCSLRNLFSLLDFPHSCTIITATHKNLFYLMKTHNAYWPIFSSFLARLNTGTTYRFISYNLTFYSPTMNLCFGG